MIKWAWKTSKDLKALDSSQSKKVTELLKQMLTKFHSPAACCLGLETSNPDLKSLIHVDTKVMSGSISSP